MNGITNWEQFRLDLLEVIADNPVSIEIRRGATTLAAQTVRVERTGLIHRRATSASGDQTTAGVVIMGDRDLNIQPKDRFTTNGILYEVAFIRPNVRSVVIAEAFATE